METLLQTEPWRLSFAKDGWFKIQSNFQELKRFNIRVKCICHESNNIHWKIMHIFGGSYDYTKNFFLFSCIHLLLVSAVCCCCCVPVAVWIFCQGLSLIKPELDQFVAKSPYSNWNVTILLIPKLCKTIFFYSLHIMSDTFFLFQIFLTACGERIVPLVKTEVYYAA